MKIKRIMTKRFFLIYCSLALTLSLPVQAIPITGSVILEGEVDSSTGQSYIGPTTVTATYSVETTTDTNGNVVLDSANSSVIFSVDAYQVQGHTTYEPWATLAIPITSVEGNPQNPTSILFSSDAWYTDSASIGVTNDSLSGHVNILGETGTMNASYVYEGKTYYYKFSAISEPSTWIILLLGIIMLFWNKRHRLQAFP